MPEKSDSALVPKSPRLVVRQAAVLGSGTMGSRIAAHLANCGIPVLLLDVLPDGDAPSSSRVATAAIQALLKSRPEALAGPEAASLLTPGNFEQDLPRLKDCDWILEAVTENLAIKQSLLARVLPNLNATALLTTNTSGLSVASIAERLGEAFSVEARKRWFGTHFFNPPRYMPLLEVIATPATDEAILESFIDFADRVLGKQVVRAHDTPNFIANRIGVSNFLTALALAFDQKLSVEEVDLLTGEAIGWPRTGTFRLADMIGIDVLYHVASNSESTTPGDARPPVADTSPARRILQSLVEKGALGDKSKKGFYTKGSSSGGDSERLSLDLSTLDYRVSTKAKFPSLDLAGSQADLGERIRLLLSEDPKKSKASAFLWPLLANLWNLAADSIGEIADDGPSIDQAMRAGFHWRLGPFAMWDAVGVAFTLKRLGELSLPISPRIRGMLDARIDSWYSADFSACYSPLTGKREAVPPQPGYARIADFRPAKSQLTAAKNGGFVRGNSGASLIDLGDSIACLELHSPKSAIGGDVVALLQSALGPGSDAVRNFKGFVIASDQDNFSVGANLLQLLLTVQEAEWEEVDLAIRAFQAMTSAIKFCPRPVVAAPHNLCLGGGAEISLHASARQANFELYIGLVEAGVGLIPGGGGTKEMLLRAHDRAANFSPPQPKDPPSKFAQSAEYLAMLKAAMETIAMAKVSTSATSAQSLGLLGPSDMVSRNRMRLLLDAKAHVTILADLGYVPPVPRTRIPVSGTAALSLLETGIYLMGEAGFASKHDQLVAGKAACVLAGGRVTPGTLLAESDLLDLEREAFLSLCGEAKTQERIAFTLKTGKPLRN